MKKVRLLGILLCFLSLGANSQNLNQISLRLSPAQFEFDYQRKLLDQKVWGEIYFGISKKDINNSYDDILAGIRIGTPLLSNEKNVIHMAASVGAYVSNNDYYDAALPVLGLGAGYTRFIGKAKRHSLLIHLGYQYGERTYKQEYQSSDISLATTGNLDLSPIHFSFGYGYNF